MQRRKLICKEGRGIYYHLGEHREPSQYHINIASTMMKRTKVPLYNKAVDAAKFNDLPTCIVEEILCCFEMIENELQIALREGSKNYCLICWRDAMKD